MASDLARAPCGAHRRPAFSTAQMAFGRSRTLYALEPVLARVRAEEGPDSQTFCTQRSEAETFSGNVAFAWLHVSCGARRGPRAVPDRAKLGHLGTFGGHLALLHYMWARARHRERAPNIPPCFQVRFLCCFSECTCFVRWGSPWRALWVNGKWGGCCTSVVKCPLIPDYGSLIFSQS